MVQQHSLYFFGLSDSPVNAGTIFATNTDSRNRLIMILIIQTQLIVILVYLQVYNCCVIIKKTLSILYFPYKLSNLLKKNELNVFLNIKPTLLKYS